MKYLMRVFAGSMCNDDEMLNEEVLSENVDNVEEKI